MIYALHGSYFCTFSIAYTALTDHESARECYRKALELDPTNQSYQNNLEIAEQKLKEAAMQVKWRIFWPANAWSQINRTAVEFKQFIKLSCLPLYTTSKKMKKLKLFNIQLRVCFGVFILQAGFNMGPMGMGNMDFSQMLNNPALMNMVSPFIQHTKLHQELVKSLYWTSYSSHMFLSLDKWASKLENCILIFLY